MAVHLFNPEVLMKEQVIHQRTNTVPFDLAPHDDNISATVRVVRPLDAAELDLETTYENFHPSTNSLGNVISHFISGERLRGVQETEEMLRLGASLTGVGELVLDNSLVRLQPPKQGLRYFLSRVDYNTLLARQESSLHVWRALTLLLGLATCATLLYALWRHWAWRRRQRKERDELEEFAERLRRRARELSLDEAAVPASACAICLTRERACVFLECGHVCTSASHFLPSQKPVHLGAGSLKWQTRAKNCTGVSGLGSYWSPESPQFRASPLVSPSSPATLPPPLAISAAAHLSVHRRPASYNFQRSPLVSFLEPLAAPPPPLWCRLAVSLLVCPTSCVSTPRSLR
ncbi:hypothetical protein P4O66_004048 [Electrophorus voltai]|uniref:RING-type E3 ubiquitin transferase n=1 Tax=Electrophorus voltai TaxID=2609070 RepID=A0AAD8ZQV3_9TELE|nr:hypothetical protein P4O66_004048 [Electrophorus voltai]